jgi:hypothetical protein
MDARKRAWIKTAFSYLTRISPVATLPAIVNMMRPIRHILRDYTVIQLQRLIPKVFTTHGICLWRSGRRHLAAGDTLTISKPRDRQLRVHSIVIWHFRIVLEVH